jgi:hypothetical protein
MVSPSLTATKSTAKCSTCYARLSSAWGWAHRSCGPSAARTIGEAATTELVAFLRLFRQLPSIDEILLNPDAAPLPDEPSARIAIATALGRALTDHSIPKGIRYLDRMPTEMRVLAMRDAAARDRAITHTKEFIRFGVEHAEVLQ